MWANEVELKVCDKSYLIKYASLKICSPHCPVVAAGVEERVRGEAGECHVINNIRVRLIVVHPISRVRVLRGREGEQ